MDRLRTLLLVLLISCPVAARAGGLSGMAVPESDGGHLGGAAADGAMGLTANPAAAAGERGAHLDLGFIVAGPTFTKAGTNPDTGRAYEPVGYRGPTYNGSGAAVFKLHERVGIGASIHFPFGRGGAYPEDGIQRFNSVASKYKVAQAMGTVAVRPTSWLEIGGSIAGLHSWVSGRVKTDLAPTIAELDPQTNPALGDPLLEGEAALEPGGGNAVTWRAGVRVEPSEYVRFGAGYQPPVRMDSHGMGRIRPSDDFAVVARGQYDYIVTFPSILNLGVQVKPAPNVALRLEVQRTGWSHFNISRVEFHDMTLQADNAELSTLLAMVGADDAGELFNKEKVSLRGTRDIWSGKLITSFSLPRDWTLHLHGGYEQHAIDEAYAHPGNIDWDSWFGGVAVEWQASETLRMYLGSTQYFSSPRLVTHSDLDPYAPPESGRAAPGGEGLYEVFFHRSSLGVYYTW